VKKRILPLLNKFSAFVASLAFYLRMALPARAQTTGWGGVCVGSTENSRDVATIQGLECLVANVFTVVITIIGLAGFIMFIIGGITWMISGGDSSKVQSARGSMTYAVVGIVVTLSAFIILNLISSFTGISLITQFRIPEADSGL